VINSALTLTPDPRCLRKTEACEAINLKEANFGKMVAPGSDVATGGGEPSHVATNVANDVSRDMTRDMTRDADSTEGTTEVSFTSSQSESIKIDVTWKIQEFAKRMQDKESLSYVKAIDMNNYIESPVSFDSNLVFMNHRPKVEMTCDFEATQLRVQTHVHDGDGDVAAETETFLLHEEGQKQKIPNQRLDYEVLLQPNPALPSLWVNKDTLILGCTATMKSDSKESWALWDHGAYRLDDPTFDLRSRKKNRIQCNNILANVLSSIPTDVQLKVDSKKVAAHKLVLAVHSRVFAEMLKANPKFSEVEIEDVSLAVVKEFKIFCYTGEVPNISTFAEELLLFCDSYDIESLGKVCDAYLEKNMTEEAAVRTLVLADCHKRKELRSRSITFIERHHAGVFETDAWKKLQNFQPDLYEEVVARVATSALSTAEQTEKNSRKKQDHVEVLTALGPSPGMPPPSYGQFDAGQFPHVSNPVSNQFSGQNISMFTGQLSPNLSSSGLPSGSMPDLQGAGLPHMPTMPGMSEMAGFSMNDISKFMQNPMSQNGQFSQQFPHQMPQFSQNQMPMFPPNQHMPQMHPMSQLPQMSPMSQFPQMSQMPSMSHLQQMPSMSQMPQMPQMTQMSQVPSMSQIPQMPSMSQMPQVPPMSQGSQIPPMSHMPQMPSMSQMPQMPPMSQMPRMPSLSQMPQMGQMGNMMPQMTGMQPNFQMPNMGQSNTHQQMMNMGQSEIPAGDQESSNSGLDPIAKIMEEHEKFMKSMSTSKVAQTNEDVLSPSVLAPTKKIAKEIQENLSMDSKLVAEAHEEVQVITKDFTKDQTSCKKSLPVADSKAVDKPLKQAKINVISSPDTRAAPDADERVYFIATNEKPSQEIQKENQTEDTRPVVKNEENQAENTGTVVKDTKFLESKNEGNDKIVKNKENAKNHTKDTEAIVKSEISAEDHSKVTGTMVKNEEKILTQSEDTKALVKTEVSGENQTENSWTLVKNEESAENHTRDTGTMVRNEESQSEDTCTLVKIGAATGEECNEKKGEAEVKAKEENRRNIKKYAGNESEDSWTLVKIGSTTGEECTEKKGGAEVKAQEENKRNVKKYAGNESEDSWTLVKIGSTTGEECTEKKVEAELKAQEENRRNVKKYAGNESEDSWTLVNISSTVGEECKEKIGEESRRNGNKSDCLESLESDSNDTLWYRNRQRKKKE